MVDWVTEHIKWILSGVGVAIIVAIISLFAGQHIKGLDQEQTSGDSSANVQVGGDITGSVNVENIGRDKTEIHEGATDSDVRKGKTMVDWITEHMKWVFSGVGVAIIVAIISLFARQHTKGLSRNRFQEMTQ